MKRKFITISIVLVSILAFIYFKYFFGWLEFRNNSPTPKEYKSLVHVSKEQYSNDSLSLVSVIRHKISNHQDPYTNAIRVNEKLEYINDSLTKIYIDSIFYSSDLKKVAFLVIVENENKKHYKAMTKKEAEGLEKEGNLPYNGTFFDGNCFIAKRTNNPFESHYYGCSFSNSRTYKENSEVLRNDYLNHTIENNNIKKPIFNVDDTRFWNSNNWNW